MSKIELNSLVSGNSVSLLNQNFTKIEDELNDKVLYRNNPDGEPNQMQVDFDMNGKRIFNLPKPENENEPVRLRDLAGLGGIGGPSKAEDIDFTPTATIVATDVQAAIEEVVADQKIITDGLQTQITGIEDNIDLIEGDLAAIGGGGSIGFSLNNTYLPSTIGYQVKQNAARAQYLWSKVRANQGDVHILVLGDSTGNEDWEWVSLMTDWLSSKAPSHTVKYRTFTDASGWGAYTTRQTGTGAILPDVDTNTIHVHNCSIAGINSFYVQGGNELRVFGGIDPDMVILNFGHNLGTDMTEDISYPEFMLSAAHAQMLCPRAGIFVTLQNPRTSVNGSAFSSRMITTWRKVVNILNLGCIDVYSRFKNHPTPGSLMGDETHPNAAGQALWLDEVKSALQESALYNGVAESSINPLTIPKPNYLNNPTFATWTGSTPSSWEFINTTAVKNTGITEGQLYSLEAVCGAGLNPQIRADISPKLPYLRGKTVTLQARIYRPAGRDLITGRIGITASNGVTSVSATSYPRGTPSINGWEYAMITVKVPGDATSLSVLLYTGAADGTDNGEKMYIGHIALFEGYLPGAVMPMENSGMYLAEYYNGANVAQHPTNTTGTLTVSNDDITLAGATSPNSGVHINLPGLIPGQKYRFSWSAGVVTGGIGGNIYFRNGFNGGSTTFDTTTWAASTAGSYTFTAPAGPVSIWYAGYTGVTGWISNDWSIKPVVEDRVFDSGTYTPTLQNTANVSSNTVSSANWMRVGNIVTVTGKVAVTPTTTATVTSFYLTLPIVSSLGATAAATLTGTMTSNTHSQVGGVYNAGGGDNRAFFRFVSVVGAASVEAYYTYSYSLQ